MTSLTSLQLLVSQSVVGQPPPVPPRNPSPQTTPNPTTIDGVIQRAFTLPAYEEPPSDPASGPLLDNTPVGIVLRANERVDTRISEDMARVSQNIRRDLGPLRLGPDNAYVRNGDTGRYYWQPDESVYYTGGTVTNPDGSVSNHSPSTSRDQGRTWTNTNGLNQPNRFTMAIARLDLIPHYDSGGRLTHFSQAGVQNSGRYLFQVDGSIFYDGGNINGRRGEPQTYVNGRWDTTRRTPVPGTMAISRTGFLPNHDGTLRCPGCGDSLHVLPNGNILNINNDGTSGSIYVESTSTWRDITREDLNSPEVRQGIQTIRNSRATRNWRYPGT